MKKMKTILYAFKEMHRLEKRLLPIEIIVAIVMAIMPFINIWSTSKIIDLISQGKHINDLLIYIFVVVGINFILFFLKNYLYDSQYVYRSLMYNKELQNVSKKLYQIEYSKIEDSDFKELIHKHSEAQNRVLSAFVQFAWMIRDFISGIITIAISIITIWPLLKIGFIATGNSYFERPIFLISIFVAIFVMLIIILFVALKMNKAWFKATEEYSQLDKIFYYFLNMFSDYKTGKEIRLYNEQKLIEYTATNKILNDGEKILKKVSLNTARSSSFVAILGSVVGFGIYLFIGVKGLYGLFGIGSLVLYCGSFMQIINGIIKIAMTFGQTEEMVPLINYYFDIINTKNDITYGNKEINLADKFEIEFKNVSFKYPNTEKFVLRNINIKISHGEKIAVVGKNGSGKTTFIKLMCRLYDVTNGEILINGINIKEYTENSIHLLYSVVFQDFKIFSIMLSENISVSENYDCEKLYDSLDKASIKERVLSMDSKEKTYLYKDIDKSGIEISGGEAQKLALARALYKDAPIVILDEPTSALDPIAENEIYSHFNSFVKNKTAIYISHRLSSCAFCDKIAVFEQGELIEYGTHKELLECNGQYKKLWDSQVKYYVGRK